MAYDNTNSGVLFVKNKKSEKQPDYEGKIDVQGKEWALACWNRTSKAGKPFLSLKISEPRIEVNGKPVKQDEDY